MVPGTGAWEEDYTRRGILWSGVTHDLPELPLGSRVLELGCGNGKTLSLMIQRGWDVTAIDLSCKAVALSRNVLKGSSTAEVMVADARCIPVKSNAFDAVFAIHVTGHVHEPDRQEIAREVTRTLKPGGILFFCDFSTLDFRFGKGHTTETSTFKRGTNIITHYFTRQEVIDLFPKLTPGSITLHQWPMRVRGKDLVRSEIKGIFSK
ncbi:MAG TPA: class I SAM-dependent methyltransferase [Methanoregula sp.]|nr:class I SAM-dependent methyltransferase [Methanoregula sp.]